MKPKDNPFIELALSALFLFAVRTASGGTFIQNPSFEGNYNTTWPHDGPINAWSGGSGVDDASLDPGGSFQDNAITADRDRVAFAEGSLNLSQHISGLTPGKRSWIQFFYNAAHCCGGTIDIVTKFGAKTLDRITNVKPVGAGNPFNFRNVPFTADSDSGTLAFSTIANGDAIAMFDAVTIVQRDADNVPIVNPSFEASGNLPQLGLMTNNIAGWIGAGQYGLDQATGGAYANNGTAPDQDLMAILNDQGSVAQAVPNLIPGQSYLLSFAYNARTGNAPHLQVKYDDTILFETDANAVGGANPYLVKTVSFSPTNTTAIITFAQTKAGDQTILLDDVKMVGQTITQPVNQAASLFADTTFSASATGVGPFTYQWRFNNADVIEKTNTTLTITNVQRANAGNYNVVVTNPSGSITSQVATLTITPFNSMYCFGYSWTDTHNCDWEPPSQYYKRRACNGPMWPEFLSTNLGLPYMELNNYAVCGAGPAQIRDQVISFLVPRNPQLSLYCLMLGTDVDVTNVPAWNQIMQTDILNNSNAVNRLYAKGARQIVVQSSQDFGRSLSFVGIAGTNTALLSNLSDYVARLNTSFSEAMKTYSQSKPDLRIVFVDMFSKLDDVRANPAQYGFTKNASALYDPELIDKSFNGPGADYMFWNYHPTSKLHKLIAAWNLEALTNSILEKLEARIVSGTPNIQMNRLQIGHDYTLQKSADLRNWQEVTSFTASAGTNLWSDAAGNDSTAYFRLKWQR